ncbi:MAG: hypothetical protein ACRD2U_02150 [Terriglobales bacterium]
MLRKSFLTVLPVAIMLLFHYAKAQPQVETVPHSNRAPGPNQRPPRYDRDKEAGESSSRDTQIDISPPPGDAKDHPFSDAGDSDAGDISTQEFHPWDPHKAAKDVEVGDFYFKRKNYPAAIARYKDALLWKDNDAEATFHLAEAFEKSNDPTQAAANYQNYLKILPHGPDAEKAERALDKLKQKDGVGVAKAGSEHSRKQP